MGGMKTKSVLEFHIPTLGLLIALSLWSAAPSALVSATGLINFSLSDGDNVTCYPIEAQKSLLNGTKFNRYPTTVITPGSYTYDTGGAKRARQTLAEEIGACPEGTIPIRAPRGIWDDHEIGPRSARKLKKFPRRPVYSSQEDVAPILENVASAPHEYGVAELLSMNSSAGYKGTEVFINVWDPPVESLEEFSLGQLWLATTVQDKIRNTIEAGYQVSKGHFGDNLPRLFVYWTADGYQQTGCYELSCPGFVQVSNTVLLGGSFSKSTISRKNGQQYEIKYLVFKDDGTGDWWLQLNDEYVGYWPKDIYNATTPFDYATVVEWGAEIVDDEYADGDLHTTTEMGSGQFANAGYGKAAYQRNLQYIDLNNTLVDAEIFVFNSEPNCYTAVKGTDYPNWRSFFFYGGKGRSPRCQHDPAYLPQAPTSSPGGSGVGLAPAPTAGG